MTYMQHTKITYIPYGSHVYAHYITMQHKIFHAMMLLCWASNQPYTQIPFIAKSPNMMKTTPSDKTYFLAGFIARIRCLQILFYSAYFKHLICKSACLLPKLYIFPKCCNTSVPLMSYNTNVMSQDTFSLTLTLMSLYLFESDLSSRSLNAIVRVSTTEH